MRCQHTQVTVSKWRHVPGLADRAIVITQTGPHSLELTGEGPKLSQSDFQIDPRLRSPDGQGRGGESGRAFQAAVTSDLRD